MAKIIDVPGMGPVEFPDAMSDDEITAAIKRNAPQPASTLDKVAGSFGGRMALGAASPALAAAQLMGEPGRKFVADVEASKMRGRKHFGTEEGVDWAGVLGALLPSYGIGKGVEKALPALANAAAGAGAKGVAARAGLGAAQGAAVAAATPAEGKDLLREKLVQAGTGGLFGGAIPLALDAGKSVAGVVAKVLEPTTEAGRAEIWRKFRTGDRTPAQVKVLQDQLRAQNGIVRGDLPTAGEALSAVDREGNPLHSDATALISYEQKLRTDPKVSGMFATREANQEAARKAVLDRIGGTPENLAAAIKARADAAEANYAAAFKQQLPSDDTLREILSTPSGRKVASRAAEIAADYRKPFKIGEDMPARTVASPILGPTGNAIATHLPAQSAEYPVESLHFMKMGFDDLIKNPERFGVGASEVKAMSQLRGEFLDWLGAKSSAYDVARETHKRMSGPIDKMTFAQHLGSVLSSPLGDKERGAMLAKAVDEFPKTFQRATGQPRYGEKGMEDILGSKDAKAVQKLIDSLTRKAMYDRLGGGTRTPSLSGSIPGHVEPQGPPLLNRYASIGNWGLRLLNQDAEDKIAQIAARESLNPALYAQSLTPPPPSRYQPLIEALMRQAPLMGGIGGGQLGREQ